MISTDALGHAASRSVYGVLSFLCTRYDGLSEHDAVRCLPDADVDLHAAARDRIVTPPPPSRPLLGQEGDSALQRDWLSKLPDDLLLNIVKRLDIAEAARTSILSRRWRQIPAMLSKIGLMVGSFDPEHDRSKLNCDDVVRANASILEASRSTLEEDGSNWQHDWLSDLHDDLLLNIIERLNIADATRTSILSRRWNQFPTMLSKILIMVGSSDNMQERTFDAARANATVLGATRSLLERRSTSPYTIHRLCMQLILGNRSIEIGRTVANAIAIHKIGVAEFAILTEKQGRQCRRADRIAYGRQINSLINDCPDTFSFLTRLKLQSLRLGETDFFPKLLKICKRLEFLHLDNCDSGFRSLLEVEHPRLRELEIFRSDFERVDLNWLPELTTLTISYWMSLHDPLSFGYVPLLHTVSIRKTALSWHKMLKLSEFLGKATISNLHLGFEKEKIWVEPEDPTKLLQVFNKLRLVNLTAISNECGLTWTMFVLQGAPYLEELCIRVCDCGGITDKDKRKRYGYSEERKDAGAKWEASDFKHRNLSVLRIFGFQSEDKFVDYARAVMEAAVTLKDIYLHEKPACKVQCGYVRRRNDRYPWSMMDKNLVRSSLDMHLRPLLRLHFLL